MFAGGRQTRRVAALAATVLAVSLGLVATASSASAAGSGSGSPASPSCPWLNQSLPVQQRVQMLLGQMTLPDKINMVTGAGFSEPYVFYISAIPSLCVPAIGEEDGPLGVGDGLTGVTELPAAVSLAASFDPALARDYGQVVGAEERARGSMADLGVAERIGTGTPAGVGREAFTEDPDLNAAMAVADIDGVQSQDEMSQIKQGGSPTTRRPTATRRPTTRSSVSAHCTRSTCRRSGRARSRRRRPRRCAPTARSTASSRARTST